MQVAEQSFLGDRMDDDGKKLLELERNGGWYSRTGSRTPSRSSTRTQVPGGSI